MQSWRPSHQPPKKKNELKGVSLRAGVVRSGFSPFQVSGHHEAAPFQSERPRGVLVDLAGLGQADDLGAGLEVPKGGAIGHGARVVILHSLPQAGFFRQPPDTT